jgi:hypothetical protein
MFEHRAEPLLNSLSFAWRMGRVFLITVLIVAVSISGGTLGYHYLVDLSWGDAFHSACLILGDHPPTHHSESEWGKIFEGIYILYARLAFFSLVTLLLLPLLHRILHKLHLEEKE